MCGRVKQLSWDEVRSVVEQLERGEALSSDPGWQATLFDRADARPKSVVAVVSGDKGTLRAQRMSWGFPVSWQASPVFNTRLESALAGGNMWELPLREHRCIVPVAAFFEKGRKGASGYAFSNDGPLLLGGVFAGMAGAVMCLSSANVFVNDMSAGTGFMAFAANQFGQWSPVGGYLATLLFGVMSALRMRLQSFGVATQLTQMLPYLAALIGIKLTGMRMRAPAANGAPYPHPLSAPRVRRKAAAAASTKGPKA